MSDGDGTLTYPEPPRREIARRTALVFVATVGVALAIMWVVDFVRMLESSWRDLKRGVRWRWFQ